MTTAAGAVSGLTRLRRIVTPEQTAAPVESCDFCNALLGERHGHVADISEHRLMCACRPCYFVFAPHGAGGGRFRAVGEDVRRVAGLRLDEATWDALRVPVDLTFVFRQSADSDEEPGLLAFYPGPAGATESELDMSAWRAIVAANPVIDQMAPDVEAVLMRRHDGSFSAHLVPIDVCYGLVGLVRSWWKGLGGGPVVWEKMAEFFDDLDRRSIEVGRT